MAKTLGSVVLVVTLAACAPSSKQGSDTPPGKDLGAQAADVVSDTDVLRAANEAAGEVVRSAGDCDAVKAALPEANQKLEDIAKSVRTVAGKTTFDAVRKRVNDIAQVCP
jgi:outer membrane murein-binding lipoprotein Lpp